MINLNDVVPQDESVQKVLVVNSGTAENPQTVNVNNLPLNNTGTGVMVQVAGISGTSTLNFRPSGSGYIVQLDNILLLQGDGTLVAIPLNSVFYGLNNNQIDSMLGSYKTAYSTLVSGITAATLHYSKLNNSGAVTSEVYNLKD